MDEYRAVEIRGEQRIVRVTHGEARVAHVLELGRVPCRRIAEVVLAGLQALEDQ